jgi:hypothetical protein
LSRFVQIKNSRWRAYRRRKRVFLGWSAIGLFAQLFRAPPLDWFYPTSWLTQPS